jgi:hypothetical protein
MNERRAIDLIRIGVTPRWLEACLARGLTWYEMADAVADQRGEVVFPDTLEQLADLWGIER